MRKCVFLDVTFFKWVTLINILFFIFFKYPPKVLYSWQKRSSFFRKKSSIFEKNVLEFRKNRYYDPCNIDDISKINYVNPEINPYFHLHNIFWNFAYLLAAIGGNKSLFCILFIIIEIHENNILSSLASLYLQRV